MLINKLSGQIISSAINVHKALGPGLLESSYRECLHYELLQEGHIVQKEKSLPLIYKTVQLDVGYRIDLLVENKIIVEIKSVKEINDIHLAQILTYLKLSNIQLGLLINFNVRYLKNGIKRVANRL